MEAKHTPGPWVMDDAQPGDLFRHVLHGNGDSFGYICRISTNGNANADADARLIAAAPELLEALQAVLRSFPTDGDMHAAGWEQTEIDLACRDYEAARAAIAKATQ